MTTPNVKRHAPHYVAWLTALVFVMAGCAGPAATPGADADQRRASAASAADAPSATSSSDAATSPAGDPTASPADSRPPDSPEPPRAILVGGADGPEAGDLGTFSWDGLVSDSPWIVQRTGSPVTPGTRLRVRFDPRLQPRAWVARWAPIRHGEAGSPRDAGSGDGGRVAVEAPMDGRAVEPPAGRDVRRREAGRVVLAARRRWLSRDAASDASSMWGSVSRRCRRPGQARAGAAVAPKIEVCASSGSITPKIFCSVRRWTQEPQLSK